MTGLREMDLPKFNNQTICFSRSDTNYHDIAKGRYFEVKYTTGSDNVQAGQGQCLSTDVCGPIYKY